MTLVLVNQGEEIGLAALLNKTAPQNLVLRLYSNDKTPAETDTEANYTEVAGAYGYAAVNLTASSWTITPGAPTEAAYPQVVFTFTGPEGAIYGYYLTQSSSGKLVWAERIAGAPFTAVENGDQLSITPKITLE